MVNLIDTYPTEPLIVADNGYLVTADGERWAVVPPDTGPEFLREGPWLKRKETSAEPEPVEPVPEPGEVGEAWEWPGASPYLGDGTYAGEYPTHYNWREDVEQVARYLVDTYGVWINTYADHPPGWGLDSVSIDCWHFDGRGVPVPFDLGDAAFWDIWGNGKPPWIRWCIWQGYIWDDYNGWCWYWDQDPRSDGGHWHHWHITFW